MAAEHKMYNAGAVAQNSSLDAVESCVVFRNKRHKNSETRRFIVLPSHLVPLV